MGVTWILAADKSRARVLEVEPHGDTPREIADFSNPAGRAKEDELRTDNLGRMHARGPRNIGHSASHETLPTEHETELFAKSLAEHLHHERTAGRFGQLWILAAPEFLGILRKKLTKPVLAGVELEVPKEVTIQGPREIMAVAMAERGKRMPDAAA